MASTDQREPLPSLLGACSLSLPLSGFQEPGVQTAVNWLVGLELLLCAYEIGNIANGCPRFPHPDLGETLMPLCIQLAEGLVCVSALYVVRSLSSATAYAATCSTGTLPRQLLSPHWLLIYLVYNFVDVLYMLFEGFVQRYNPTHRYRYYENDWSFLRGPNNEARLPDSYTEQEERARAVLNTNSFLSGARGVPRSLRSLGGSASFYLPIASAAWWGVFVAYKALFSPSQQQEAQSTNTSPSTGIIYQVLFYMFVISQLALCVVVPVLSGYPFWSPYCVVELLAIGFSVGVIYAVRSKKHARVLIIAFLVFTLFYSLWVACYAMPTIYASRKQEQWFSLPEVEALAEEGQDQLADAVNEMISTRTCFFMRLFIVVELIYYTYVCMGCITLHGIYKYTVV